MPTFNQLVRKGRAILHCKLFPADKFHKIRYLFDRR